MKSKSRKVKPESKRKTGQAQPERVETKRQILRSYTDLSHITSISGLLSSG
jgi:hypothetical protein